MSRNANIVILCEDGQHEAFIRRFLERRGFERRKFRVEKAPPGQGSAEQFVRERYPHEVGYYRSRKHRVDQGLVVMIDADRKDRGAQLQTALAEAQVPDRAADERIAIFAPARNIETWLAWLDGHEVNEDDAYPRLANARDCQRHVEALATMCDSDTLRQPTPPSLQAACSEYTRRLRGNTR